MRSSLDRGTTTRCLPAHLHRGQGCRFDSSCRGSTERTIRDYLMFRAAVAHEGLTGELARSRLRSPLADRERVGLVLVGHDRAFRDDRAFGQNNVPGDGSASSGQTTEVFDKTGSPSILRPCCDAGTGMGQRWDRRGSTRGDQLVCWLRESPKERLEHDDAD